MLKRGSQITIGKFYIVVFVAILLAGICTLFFLLQAGAKTSLTLLTFPAHVEEIIIECIDTANESIDVAMYIFTNERIARALVNAKERGAVVRVILGNTKGKEVQDVMEILSNAGIAIKTKTKFATMHAKYVIIDKRTVIVGSHNWTKSAMFHNREVSVLIYDEKFAKELLRVFEEDWYY